MTEAFDITLNVNGRDYPVPVEARRTLVDAIRGDCGLTGTHIGCEHGVCGACTVILDGDAVRSCLMFAVKANGRKIRTVEGLADGDALHPIQQAFIDNHGLHAASARPVSCCLRSMRWNAIPASATTRCWTSWPRTCAAAPATRTSSRPCGGGGGNAEGGAIRDVDG